MTTTRDELGTSLFIYVKDVISGKVNRLAIPSDTQVGTMDNPAELQLTGRFSMATREVSANVNDIVTMSNHDTILCVKPIAVSGSMTVKLPGSPRDGQIHYIKDTGGHADVCNIVVIPADSTTQTIDGASSTTILSANGGISCFWKSGSWRLLVSTTSGGGGGGSSDITILAGRDINVSSSSIGAHTDITISTNAGFDRNATYIVLTNTGSLNNELALVAGANISITPAGSSVTIASTVSAGTSDPSASYYVFSATGSLPNSRVLSASTGLIFTDHGPASTADYRINDNVVATVTGTRFTGPVVALAGLTGSIFTTPAGLSFIAGSQGVTVASASNGQITLGANNNILATISGSTFQQLTGSLQKTASGLSYLVGGANITVTSASNGQVTIMSTITGSSSGGSGDADASYIVLSATSSLTNERVLAAGTGISIIDGGSNSNVTISTDLTTISTSSNEWETAFDISFGLLASQTITDGPNTIDGYPWTAQNVTLGASAFAIVPGDGLRITPNSTSTEYNSSGAIRTAPLIKIKLVDVIPNFSLGTTRIRLWVINEVADASTDTRVGVSAIDRWDAASTGQGVRAVDGFVTSRGGRTKQLDIGFNGLLSVGTNISTQNTLTVIDVNDIVRGQGSFFSANPGLADANVSFPSITNLTGSQLFTIVNTNADATFGTTYLTGSGDVGIILSAFTISTSPGSFSSSFKRIKLEYSNAVSVSVMPTDSNSSFILLTSSLAMPAARVLTAGPGITITDGGPNGNVTISSQLTGSDGWITAVNINFANLSASIVDGANTIANLPWTAKNVSSGADVVAVVPGDGLRIDTNATNTNWYWITDDAPKVSLNLADVIPRFIPGETQVRVTAQFDTFNADANVELAAVRIEKTPFVANNVYIRGMDAGYYSGVGGAARFFDSMIGTTQVSDLSNIGTTKNVARIVMHDLETTYFFSSASSHPYSTNNSTVFGAGDDTYTLEKIHTLGAGSAVTSLPFYGTGSRSFQLSLGVQTGNTANSLSASFQRLMIEYRQPTSFIPKNSMFLVASASGQNPNERELAAGTNITLIDGGPGQALTINSTATGGGSGDNAASYVVLGLTGSLLNERVLTAGPGILITDGGANNTVTISTAAVTGSGGWQRIVDTNFTQLTPQTFSDGTSSIGGNSWIVLNSANAQGIRIDANGLVMSASTTNITKYYQNADNAPQIKINIGTLIPEFVLGQSQLRVWILGGSNGNANHEVLTFLLQKAPWTGAVSNQPTWAWALGAYDSLNPHNGIYVTQGTTSRTDVDFTSRTAANSPSTSVLGMHWKDVGDVGFYYRTITGSLSADTNDTVNQFKNMKLGAEQRASTQASFAASSLNDIESSHAMTDASSLELCLAISTVNTAGHLIATVKRIVIEWKI